MSADLSAALCLVLVIEGMLLFLMPGQWKAMMRQACDMDSRHLRMFGGAAMLLGVVVLQFVG